MKIILTGATGMVGEGVLLTCLKDSRITEVLSVSRRSCGIEHPKLKELLLSDFNEIDWHTESLQGLDACLYCAGISSVGMNEAKYTQITYDITLHFAATIKNLNPNIVFSYISGAYTDSTEKGSVMWARVKGRTENALQRLFPGKQYNFRPALMNPLKGQKNLKGYNKVARFLYPVLSLFFPAFAVEILGIAMINVSVVGYDKNVLEVKDIKKISELRF